MRLTTALFLFVTANIAVHAQSLVGAWMQGAGNSVAAVSAFQESYSFYAVGERPTDNTGLGVITARGATLYAASGITDFLDVIVNVPWISTGSDAGFWETQTGLQDVSAALRVRPLSLALGSQRLDVVVAGVYSTPMSDYVPDLPVTIGHQVTAVEGRVLLHYVTTSGWSFTGQGGYLGRGRVTVDRGFDVDAPDQVEFWTKAAWGDRDWYGDVWLQHVVPQSGTNIGPGVPFPSNAQGFTRIGATIVRHVFADWSVVAGLAGTLDARNVGYATRFNLGFVHRLPSWSGVQL